MYKSVKLAVALVFSATLAACTAPYGAPNQNLCGSGMGSVGGAVIGGAGGGVLGNQVGKGSGRVAATIAGTLLGAGVGSSVGSSVERGDCAYQMQQHQGMR